MKAIRKKGFTLVELIIVIVVIGLLAGLTVPKFISISRDAQVATLYQDMDVLKKAIDVYYINEETYPISDKVELPEKSQLLDMIKNTGDSGTELYKVDLKKSGKYHTRLKHGYEKSENDYFIYSLETHQLFYAKGVMNGEGKYVYGYNMSGLRNVMLGKVLLIPDQLIEMEAGEYVLTGEVPAENTVEVYINDELVPVSYEETANISLISVYAGEDSDNIVYKKFTSTVSLQPKSAYSIKVVTDNKETNYHIQTTELAPIRWHGLPREAFDRDETTNTSFSTEKIITWDGDLTHKAVSITAHAGFLESGRIYIKDKDGNTLTYYTTDGKTVTDYLSFGDKVTHQIIIPKEAASIVISPYLVADLFITDIHEAEDLIPTAPVSNVQAEPGKARVTLSWNHPKDEDFQKAWIFRDDVLVGTTDKNYFTDLGLAPDTNYSYSIKAQDETGNLSKAQNITVTTLKRSVVWSGLDPAAFDGSQDTTVGTTKATITWTGDLTNKAVQFHIRSGRSAYGYSNTFVTIKDENGKNLSFLDTLGNQMTEMKFASSNAQFSLVIPENATSIQITCSDKMTIYDIIENEDEIATAPVSNIQTSPEKTSMTLNWKNPADDDFKEVWIFRNGTKVGAATDETFTDIGLEADTEYSYQLYAIDATGNMSEEKTVTAKTLKREIVWQGLSTEAFDGFSTTSVSGGTSTILTWDGNLAHKTVHFHLRTGHSAYGYSLVEITMQDANGNNLTFTDIDNNSMTSKKVSGTVEFDLIVPEGAVQIKLTCPRAMTIYDIYESSLKE